MGWNPIDDAIVKVMFQKPLGQTPVTHILCNGPVKLNGDKARGKRPGGASDAKVNNASEKMANKILK